MTQPYHMPTFRQLFCIDMYINATATFLHYIFVVLLSLAAVRDVNICQYWPIHKMHHYFQC